MASIKLTRLQLNGKAFPEIMNSEPVMAAIGAKTEEARRFADGVGTATYRSDVQPGRNRCHGLVWTPSLHAIRSNAKHNTLLKAYGSLGGR